MNLKDPDLLRTHAYINGRWTIAPAGATQDVANPATGRKIGTVPDLGLTETREAIEAAAAAFQPWLDGRPKTVPFSCVVGSTS